MKSYNGDMVHIFWTTLDTSTSMLDPDNVIHKVGFIKDAIDTVMGGPSKGVIPCALFYPKDVKEFGSPVNPEVSFEEFCQDPCKYGVSLFKSPTRTYSFD